MTKGYFRDFLLYEMYIEPKDVAFYLAIVPEEKQEFTVKDIDRVKEIYARRLQVREMYKKGNVDIRQLPLFPLIQKMEADKNKHGNEDKSHEQRRFKNHRNPVEDVHGRSSGSGESQMHGYLKW